MEKLLEPSPTIRKRRRWKPTGWQQHLLRKHFEEQTRFPSSTECEALAEQTGESARRIRVWFQNHRQRQEEEVARTASSLSSPPAKEGVDEDGGGRLLPTAEAIPMNTTSPPMALLTPLSQRFSSEPMDPQEVEGFFKTFQSALGEDVESGPATPVQSAAALGSPPASDENDDVDTSPPTEWLDLPPPDWAVFAACSMRAFPTLQLDTILTGIQKVLPFEGHARLFEAAKQGALAHAVAHARETAPDIAEADIKYWSERLLLCEARSIASYCFRRVAGLHGV